MPKHQRNTNDLPNEHRCVRTKTEVLGCPIPRMDLTKDSGDRGEDASYPEARIECLLRTLSKQDICAGRSQLVEINKTNSLTAEQDSRVSC